MQTFLPYRDFEDTFRALDYRRLGKQRVEAHQILNILLDRTETKGWRNHPATKMWSGYEDALKLYYNLCIVEWTGRGYNNNMLMEKIIDPIMYPEWLGDESFHASHRSNLLRKDYNYYSKFDWKELPNLEYIWPIK